MNRPELSDEEQALLDAVEDGNLESVLTDSRRSALQSIAANTTEMSWHSDILSTRKQKIENGDARFISLEALKEYYKR